MVVYFFAIGLSAFSQNTNQPTFHNLDADFFGVKRIGRALYSKALGKMYLVTNKGLGIYNGYKTKLFTHYDSLDNCPLSNNIVNLYEDAPGNLWMGYNDLAGLSKFDPKTETFTHFKYEPEIKGCFPNSVPSRFLEDSQGNFWMSTWDGGLLLFNKSRTQFKIISKDDQPKAQNWFRSNAIRDLIEIEPGKLMVSYFHEQEIGYPGIFDIKKNTVTPFPIDEYKGKLSEGALNAIKRMLCIVHFIYNDKKNGKLWIGTYSGLVYIDLKNKTCKRISGKTFDENVWSNLDNTTEYIIDENERLWASTANSGIMVVDLKTTKAFYATNFNNCSNCITDNLISGFTKDNDNNIWVTSGAKGVSIYTPFKHQFKLKEWSALNVTFSNASHQSIPLNKYYMRQNKKIYLTSANGISVFDFEKDSLLETLKFSNGYADNDIKFIKDNIYLRLYFNKDGVSKFSIYNLNTKKSKESSAVRRVESVLFKNDSTRLPIYFMLHDKSTLCSVDSNLRIDTALIIKTEKGLSARYSQYLQNGKWFLLGADNSFMIYDPVTQKIITYGYKGKYDKLFNDSTYLNFHYTKKGIMYITTRNGINSYNEKTGEVKYLNKELGLEKITAIYGIVEDSIGNLWFTGSRDFYKYDIQKKKLICFNRSIGMKSFGFDHKGDIHHMISDGRNIFFPTMRGLLYFDAFKVNLPNTPVTLNVFNVNINDSALSTTHLNDFLNSKLDLNYDQNNLLIEYFTNQMYVPSPNKFTYCLLDLSNKWVDNELSNKINLQNLPSGTYTLIVKCKNSYQIESDDYSIVFTINKPFWKTWWFIFMILCALVIVVFYIIRSRTKALQKRQAELERTVEERTQEVVNKAAEINKQKELIEEKQKEIVDSINYAERIQKSFMATKESLDSNLPDYFIFFKPKDIVSGDFYWSATLSNGNFALVTADSTGHGVPGAIMSLLNITSLEKAIEKQVLPHEILNDTRKTIIERLKNDGSEEGGKDGMDCSICVYDLKKMKLYIAAAHNPLWIIRKKEAIEIKADKMPVGKHDKQDTSFNLQEIDLQKNDLIITITDGFGDQFGGEKGKKFKNKKLRELIIENAHLPLVEQKENLARTFNEWKDNLEQIDDVCVIGVKI